LCCEGFNTLHQPLHRDKIRFEQRNGRLRNMLDPGLPALAADAVSRLRREDHENGRSIARVVSHGGGRDVIDALQKSMPEHDLTPSRAILRDYGNMSSPSVLFALESLLQDDARPTSQENWWMVSFGAGFSVHSCRIGVP
jgi:alkylresorcinol/alkylpyrone synthase